MDETLKKACYDEAEKCTEGDTLERTVLKSLIINHKNQYDKEFNPSQKKPNAEYIAGPYSLSLQWSEEYKKLIYIFGEWHNSKTDCEYYDEKGKTGEMLIENYLEQLFNYSDVFIDFYHEYHGYYKISDYEDPTENMKLMRSYKIWEKIKTCVHKSTRDLPGNNCQKGRMHYIDIRTMNGTEVNISSAFINLYIKSEFNIEKQQPEEKISKLNIFFNDKQVKKFLDGLFLIQMNQDLKDFFKKEFNEYVIYNNQVNKSSIAEEIKKFINDKINNIDVKYIFDIFWCIKSLSNILNNYKNKEDNYEFKDETHYNQLKGFLEILSISVTEVNYLIVDGYLLARIFKTFETKPKDPNKQRPTDEPEEPHNIIIYAGIYHSNNYRRFLDNIGFKTIEYAGNGKEWQEFDKEKLNPNPNPANCIDMKGFQQPFFSKRDDVNWLSLKRKIGGEPIGEQMVEPMVEPIVEPMVEPIGEPNRRTKKVKNN